MSGTKPKFMEGRTVPIGYYDDPNPYIDAPRSKVNLLEMSRYAKKNKKKLVELTREEVELFTI